jgi:hypothetical protein
MRTVTRLTKLVGFLLLASGCMASTEDEGTQDDEEAVDTASMDLGVNLLANSGFESPLSDNAWGHWRKRADWPADTLLRIGAAAFAGSYGLRIVDTSVNHLACVDQLAMVEGSVEYRVQGKARRLSGSGVQRIAMMFLDDEQYEVPGSRIAVGAGTGDTWHTVSRDFVTPASARYVWVMVGDCARIIAAATYDWDNVRLQSL